MFFDHFKVNLERMLRFHPVFQTHIDLMNQAKIYNIAEVSQYYHSRPQVYMAGRVACCLVSRRDCFGFQPTREARGKRER